MLDLSAKIDTEQAKQSLTTLSKTAKKVTSDMINDFERFDAAILATQKRLYNLGQIPVFSLLSQGLKRAQQEFHKLDSGLVLPEINESATNSVKEFTDALLRMDKVLSEISVRNNAFDALSNSIVEMGQQLDRFLAKMGEMQQKAVAPSNSPTASPSNAASGNAQTTAVKEETIAYKDLLSELERVAGAKEENILLMESLRAQNTRYKASLNVLANIEKNGRTLTEEQVDRRQRLSLAYEENKVAISKLRSELMNQIKLEQSAQGSMDEMSQALSRMRVVYRSLNENERNSTFGQNLLKNIEVLDAKIKELDASTGIHARNVGNYSSSFNGLFMSIQQVARELPSLAYGPQVFFSAISNNLPILSDEISRARKEYQELLKTGQKGTPVWKQIISSIVSWQTALVAGITVLTVYGKDISDWIGSLFKGKQALDSTKIALEQFHTAMTQGSISAQTEITKLKLLYKAATDAARPYEERKRAVEKLQDTYPAYFGNMDTELIMAGNLKSTYDKLKDSILETARARAAMNTIVKNEETIIKIESTPEYEQIKQYQKYIDEVKSQYEQSNKTKTGAALGYSAQYLGIQLSGYQKQIDKLSQKIIKDLDLPTTIGSDLEGYIKTLNEVNNKLESEAQFLTTEISPDDLNKEEAARRQAAERAAAEAKRQFEQLQSSLQKLREDALQTEIDLMEEGTAKKLAQIDLDYRTQLQAIKDNEQKIADAQGGSLTSEQKGYFQTQRDYANKKRSTSISNLIVSDMPSADDVITDFQEEQKSWEEYYIAYGTFREKLQATKEKYDRQLSEASNEAERRSVEAARDEALAALELEGSEWAKTILTWSTEQLSEKIAETTDMLEKALDAYNSMTSSSTSEAQQYRIEIAKLKAQINLLEKVQKEVDSDEEPQQNSSKWTDIAQALESVGNGAREAASSIRDINEDLADLLTTAANVVTGLGQMANAIGTIKNAASALDKASAVFAAISAGIQIVSGIFSLFDDGSEEIEAYRQEVSDLNRELEQLKINSRMETEGTIFGDDLWKTAINNIEEARTQLQEYQKALDAIKNRYGKLGLWQDWLQIPDFESAADSLANMAVLVRERSGFAKLFGAEDEYTTLKQAVPELFDNDGGIDMDALTEFVDSDTFKRLSNENQEYIKDLVDSWDNYQQALENVNAYLTDIFGDLGNTISDALADAFANGTDAAQEFTDSVSEMIEKMAKNIAYSSILAPIFDAAQERFKNIFGDASLSDEERFSAASAAISELLYGITEGQSNYNKLLEQLQQIAEEQGISIFQPTTESSQSGTSRGFSTMSQDTASELNGRFTDIQGKINILVEQAAYGRSISIEQLNRMTDTRDILVQMNGNVADIRTFTKVLPEMRDSLAAMNRKLDNL